MFTRKSNKWLTLKNKCSTCFGLNFVNEKFQTYFPLNLDEQRSSHVITHRGDRMSSFAQTCPPFGCKIVSRGFITFPKISGLCTACSTDHHYFLIHRCSELLALLWWLPVKMLSMHAAWCVTQKTQTAENDEAQMWNTLTYLPYLIPIRLLFV